MTEAAHSFAVLAHGESPFLDECLRSLKDQNVRSEIYLATSTPSPFLSEAAARHGLEIKVNPARAGIAADWTFAYQQCRTRYLTLAHQDDLYHPRYAGACLTAANTVPGNLITFTDFTERSADREFTITVNLALRRLMLSCAFGRQDRISGQRAKRGMLALACTIPCPTVMFNTATIGTFAFEPALAIDLDWEAWLRLASRPGDFVYVRERLVSHRVHGGAQTVRAIASGARRSEDQRILEQLWPAWLAAVIARLYSFSLVTKRWYHR